MALKKPKIGRPGYKVLKQKDPENGQKSLLFEILYPEIGNLQKNVTLLEDGTQPRHRFMSAFEQKIEIPNRDYQYLHFNIVHHCRYLLFAAEPYETIAFKVPNKEIERDPLSGKYYFHWDRDKKIFTVLSHSRTYD